MQMYLDIMHCVLETFAAIILMGAMVAMIALIIAMLKDIFDIKR